MNGWDWAVVGFLTIAYGERIVQSFVSQATVAGEQRMRWSLYAMCVNYTIIVWGSCAEHFLVRRPPVVWVSAVGLVMYVVSVVLRKTAIRTLGKFWSLQVEIRSEHQLIREGVYNVVRHPIYAAIILEVTSIPLVANAWGMVAYALVTHVSLIMFRMRNEEQALVDKMGDLYRGYQREVGALLPKCACRRGPQDDS